MLHINQLKSLAQEQFAPEKKWWGILSSFRTVSLSTRSEKSVNYRIFAALVTVGSFGVAVKLVATLKEITVAQRFGVGDYLDAFLIAYLLPSVAINVISGSFNAALIPTYIQVREQQGESEAQRLFSSILVLGIVLLIGASLVLMIGASSILPLLGSGFTGEKLGLTRSLFLLLLPILPLTGVSTIWSAMLNAGERFALPSVTPIITPIVAMISVYSLTGRFGAFALALPIVCGSLLECTLLGTALRRQGVLIMPRWHGRTAAVMQVTRQYVPMLASALTMNGTVLVDQSMAAMLGSGSVSALNYGNRVPAMLAAIGTISLSTAVLPHLSRMTALGDWKGIRQTLKTFSALILVVAVPATVLLIVFSEAIVELLFQRGAFTPGDSAHVASIQRFYLVQLPFYVLSMLFVRLTSALKASSILLWGALINFTLNAALDYQLMKWFGLRGIAMSTSMVYAVSLCYLSFMSLRILRRVEN